MSQLIKKKWWSKGLRRLVAWLLAIIILGIIIHQGPKLWTALHKVRLHWVVAGMGCYSINYFLRAIRFRIIMRQLRLWPDAVISACLHGFATYLLPFRTGDIALPVILKSLSNSNLIEGTKVLLKARLLDLSSLGIWILCAALLLKVEIPATIHIPWIIFGTGLIILPKAIKWVAEQGKLRTTGVMRRISEWGSVASITSQEFFISLGIWAAIGACLYCTARAVGLDLSIGGIWFLITIQLPLQLLPIQGFANAGNHEGGWIAALAILGVPVSEGLEFALTSHAIILLYVLLLGLFAFTARKGVQFWVHT